MPDGTELAKAYVQIVPSAKGIKGSISSVLSGEAASAGKSAGETVGLNFAGALKKAIAGLAIGKLIKQSLTEGADLQQSLGGIETLFKYDADTVKKYAAEAYKTAGLSANEYMEQVTSFSASLLQSLGGDTAKAAESANAAIIAMADNANKMGTDMSSIQNAYQGFAKQNYTMLDNLKLGYGGTKQEMERLLKDAELLSGIEYNIENLNDVYSAIQVIQDSLGITGTTAKEAEETFTGSLAAMKAAVQNLLGNLTLGEDIEPALWELSDTVETFLFKNLFPMIGNLLKQVPSVIEGFLGNQGLTSIIRQMIPKAEEFVESGVEIVTGLIEGIGSAVPYLIENLVKLLAALGKAIVDVDWVEVAHTMMTRLRDAWINAAKEILGESGGEMVRILLMNVGAELSEAFARIKDTISDAFARIKAAFDPLVQHFEAYVESGRLAHDVTNVLVTGIQLLSDAVVFAAEAIAAIVEKVAEFVNWLRGGSTSAEVFKTVITAVAAAILAYKAVMLALAVAENIATIAQMALNAAMSLNPIGLVIAGIAALVAIIVILVKNIDTISAGLESLWESVKSGAQKIFETLTGVFGRIGDFFKNLYESAKSWGHDLIQNFIDGIKERIQHFIDTIKGIAQSVRDFLGFSEPKLGPLSNFHTYAPDMMELFAQGIRQNAGLVTNQIDKAFDIGSHLSDYAVGGVRTLEPRQEPAYAAVSSGGRSNGGAITGVVSFTGTDQEIVRALGPKLELLWSDRGKQL